MKYYQIRHFILLLTLTFIGFACDDSATSPSEGSGTAVINGRVEGDTSAEKAKGTSSEYSAVEGAVVTAAQVTADGSLSTIGAAEAETNAEGKFTLQLDASAVTNASNSVVLLVEKESQQWKAFVAQKLESGSSVKVKPITIESTAEASVYQQVVANEDADLVSKADIEAYIGSKTAAELQNNTQAVAEFANALAAEARTRAEILASQSAELSEEQMNQVANAKVEALVKLNTQLYASASATSQAEAYQTFIEAVAQAHTEAEVDAGAYAKAKEAATHLVIENTTELSDTARSEVRANAAALVSVAIDQAVQARMKAEGVSESTINVVAQAGTELRSELMAKATATEEEVEALFDTYNEAVVDALGQEFSANAELLVTANSQIGGTASAKTALEAAIEANITTDVVVQAYTTFYEAVETVVNEVITTASDAEAALFADVMVLINISN